jgi:hypothetical protein
MGIRQSTHGFPRFNDGQNLLSIFLRIARAAHPVSIFRPRIQIRYFRGPTLREVGILASIDTKLCPTIEIKGVTMALY